MSLMRFTLLPSSSLTSDLGDECLTSSQWGGLWSGDEETGMSQCEVDGKEEESGCWLERGASRSTGMRRERGREAHAAGAAAKKLNCLCLAFGQEFQFTAESRLTCCSALFTHSSACRTSAQRQQCPHLCADDHGADGWVRQGTFCRPPLVLVLVAGSMQDQSVAGVLCRNECLRRMPQQTPSPPLLPALSSLTHSFSPLPTIAKNTPLIAMPPEQPGTNRKFKSRPKPRRSEPSSSKYYAGPAYTEPPPASKLPLPPSHWYQAPAAAQRT